MPTVATGFLPGGGGTGGCWAGVPVGGAGVGVGGKDGGVTMGVGGATICAGFGAAVRFGFGGGGTWNPEATLIGVTGSVGAGLGDWGRYPPTDGGGRLGTGEFPFQDLDPGHCFLQGFRDAGQERERIWTLN